MGSSTRLQNCLRRARKREWNTRESTWILKKRAGKKHKKAAAGLSFSFPTRAHTHNVRAPFYCSHQRRFQPNVAQKHRCFARASRRGESGFKFYFALHYVMQPPRHISLSLYFIASHRFCHLWSWPESFLFAPRIYPEARSFWEPGSRRTFTSSCSLFFTK